MTAGIDEENVMRYHSPVPTLLSRVHEWYRKRSRGLIGELRSLHTFTRMASLAICCIDTRPMNGPHPNPNNHPSFQTRGKEAEGLILGL